MHLLFSLHPTNTNLSPRQGLTLSTASLIIFNLRMTYICLDGHLSRELPGCFGYYGSYGSYLFQDRQTLTINSCMDHCKTKGMTFFILDAGRDCRCANTMPTSAIFPDADCNAACTGEPGTVGKCGGDYRSNVHASFNLYSSINQK